MNRHRGVHFLSDLIQLVLNVSFTNGGNPCDVVVNSVIYELNAGLRFGVKFLTAAFFMFSYCKSLQSGGAFTNLNSLQHGNCWQHSRNRNTSNLDFPEKT